MFSKTLKNYLKKIYLQANWMIETIGLRYTMLTVIVIEEKYYS